MLTKQQFYFVIIALCLVTFPFVFMFENDAEARPVDPDDSWKVHVSASGHIPGISGMRVQWWWNTAAPEWTYTDIIRCDNFYPDPAPAASQPVNCTKIATKNSDTLSSYSDYYDTGVTEGRYYWYKVRVWMVPVVSYLTGQTMILITVNQAT